MNSNQLTEEEQVILELKQLTMDFDHTDSFQTLVQDYLDQGYELTEAESMAAQIKNHENFN